LVDRGDMFWELEAFLGGFSTQDDQATLALTFHRASGLEIERFFIGGNCFEDGSICSDQRGGVTGLVPVDDDGVVPVGARSATITLTMSREAGTSNDGYADSLSFVLR
ncbi:MAG: hypothetical protein O6913_06205, partial [Chloroflexi bacterium]|nr:hypothetical protein [Chloroflexota bacterium]